MPRPNTPKIIVPTRKSPADPSKRCGGTWSDYVSVVKPYLGNARVAFELEPLADYTDFESFEEGPGLLRNAQGGIDSAKEMFAEHRDFIDKVNRNAIQKILDRAQKYVTVANQIWYYWNEQYRFYAGGGTGWALGLKLQDFLPGQFCWNKASGEKVKTSPMAGDNLRRDRKITWYCPQVNITGTHYVDEQNYPKLVEAALLNARCAQEAVAAVASYYRNKAAQGPESAYRISAAPKVLPKRRIALKKVKLVPSEQEPEFEPGAPMADTEGEVVPTDEAPSEPSEPTKKRKKKGSGLLIAGGLAVAFFALKK